MGDYLVGFVDCCFVKGKNQPKQAATKHTFSPSVKSYFLANTVFSGFVFINTLQICEVIMICPFLSGIPKKVLLENFSSIKCLSLQRVAHFHTGSIAQ